MGKQGIMTSPQAALLEPRYLGWQRRGIGDFGEAALNCSGEELNH